MRIKCKAPDFRTVWLSMTRSERDELVSRLGTSYKYLQLMAGGFKLPSLEFACRMVTELPCLQFQEFVRAFRARTPKA